MTIAPIPALAAALGLFAATAAPAATTFTDAAAFGAATTGVTVETFDDRIADAVLGPNVPITFANGTTSAVTVVGQINRVQDGRFTGGTRRGRDASFDQTVRFDFGREVTAFGGDFTSLDGIVVSGVFDGMAESVRIEEQLGAQAGFFGLTSTTPFRTVTFSTVTGGFLPFGNPTVSLQAKNFGLDNLALGDAAGGTPVVPLPATALLLLGGLGGLGALRAARRS